MEKQKILKYIDELGDLYADLVRDPDLFKLAEDKTERAIELRSEIIDYLVWSPGTLIYEGSPERIKRNKTVVDVLWKTIESEEIFNELLSGGYGGRLAHMLGDFSERLKMLKPTFISINPENTEFKAYFEEAMNAWLFGQKNAALILCFSILENAIKDRLCQINIEYVYELKDPTNPKGVKTTSFDKIIKSAYREELISNTQKNALFDIKSKRNNVIHELQIVDSKEVYESIITTKDIIEHLLSNSGS